MRGSIVVVAALAQACIDMGSKPPDAGADAIVDIAPIGTPQVAGNVDLLIEVDNSCSNRDNQTNLMAQLGTLVQMLLSPPCLSHTNPAPHVCDATNAADVPQYPRLESLHVGIVSVDLGTPGSSVPGCVNADHGDNGALNPIHFGDALRQHEPWFVAPPSYGRPTDCTNEDAFPPYLSFSYGADDPARFTHDLLCNAGLYVDGCGLEQQLESIYRALVTWDASDHAGNTGLNAGFLRDDALLAIVMMTDEEDGSVRNCMFPTPGASSCSDALDVFNAASSAWSSVNLNLRDYLYQPGSAQDPTWPLERYIDPHDASAGWLGLKPGHPERVVFAAIAGIPLDGWRRTDGSTNWNALLGTPGADPNDFTARDSSTSIDGMSREGPISMHQANPDPNCPERTVPACRRQGSAYMPMYCTTDQQYFAWPSRRVVEVARRFDQASLCGGRPCHNGLVESVCTTDDRPAIERIARLIQSRMASGS